MLNQSINSRWSADNVFTCLVNLLATTTAVTFVGLWCRRHRGFCYVLPGLLQLSAGWHCRRPSSAPPVSSEHCSSFGLRGSTPRPHHFSSCKPPLSTRSQDCCGSAYTLKPRATELLVPLTGHQWLYSASSSYLVVPWTDGPMNLDFSRSAGLHSVHTFDMEQTTCMSVIDEHNITNVLAQVEDVPVPAATIVVLWQHWPVSRHLILSVTVCYSVCGPNIKLFLHTYLPILHRHQCPQQLLVCTYRLSPS